MAKNSNKKQKSKKALSKQDIKQLAHLVRLELTDDEISMLEDQLGETIDYIQNLSELETDGVRGLSHTTDAKNVTFDDGIEPTRTFTQDEATKNAKKSKNGYFIVDKILDK